MAEKRMLILPSGLVKKIDDNRGDMSQAEFIQFLIDSKFNEADKTQQYATEEELLSFKQDIKKLLRNFLDFFIGYGLELGKQSAKTELQELSSKLKGLEDDLASDGNDVDNEVKIKWK